MIAVSNKAYCCVCVHINLRLYGIWSWPCWACLCLCSVGISSTVMTITPTWTPWKTLPRNSKTSNQTCWWWVGCKWWITSPFSQVRGNWWQPFFCCCCWFWTFGSIVRCFVLPIEMGWCGTFVRLLVVISFFLKPVCACLMLKNLVYTELHLKVQQWLVSCNFHADQRRESWVRYVVFPIE